MICFITICKCAKPKFQQFCKIPLWRMYNLLKSLNSVLFAFIWQKTTENKMPSTNSQLEEHYVDSITRMFLAKEPEFLSSNPDEPWYRIRVKWNKFALIKRKEFTSRSTTIFDQKCESFTTSDGYYQNDDDVNRKRKRRYRRKRRYFKRRRYNGMSWDWSFFLLFF